MNNLEVSLDERLVQFAGEVILFTKELKKDAIGIYFSDQIGRSAAGAALNFGEFQGGESKKDKIHKLGIVLKEINETRIALRIIIYINQSSNDKAINLLSEANQLGEIIASIIKKKKIGEKI